jgi:hypothetical protein
MPIVLISEALLLRSTLSDGRILCDRVLCGFCVRMRPCSPRFMFHHLRKLVATVGEKLGLGNAELRRILDHAALKSDVLRRHYAGLCEANVAGAMVQIQVALTGLMGSAHQGI